MRSVCAVAAGLFAEVVVLFAFVGIAQQAESASWRLLTFLLVGTLALIGAVSTYVARGAAAPGAGRAVATLVSGAIFASLVLIYLWESVVSLQHSGR